MHKGLLVGGVINLGLGLVLHIAGMGTDSWSTGGPSDSRFGVFENNVSDDGVGLVTAMIIIGLLVGAASTATSISLIFSDKWAEKTKKTWAIVVLVTGIVAAVAILIGLISWGTQQHDDETLCISHSFALCCSGMLLFAMGSVTSFVAHKQ